MFPLWLPFPLWLLLQCWAKRLCGGELGPCGFTSGPLVWWVWRPVWAVRLCGLRLLLLRLLLLLFPVLACWGCGVPCWWLRRNWCWVSRAPLGRCWLLLRERRLLGPASGGWLLDNEDSVARLLL